jgi:glycosidase
VPYLYMGDEVAFPGGNDPDMRRDMKFEEAGLDSMQMVKSGASYISLTNQQTDLRSWVRKLAEVRTHSKALRRGDRTTLLGTDGDFWIYAYTSGTEAAVVAVNRGASGSRTVAASALGGSGAAFTSPLGTGSASLVGGNLTVTLGAGEAAIFVR